MAITFIVACLVIISFPFLPYIFHIISTIYYYFKRGW